MNTRSYMVEPVRDPARPWAPSPFNRLARTHALSVAGDAMFTTAMAGLVFFSVTKLNQARWQVVAALVFTIVPLSLAAPFIGPLIDRARGGRKWMIVALCLLRGLMCFVLVWHRDNQLAMYPEFTLVLVMAQGYILARGALVPATVHNDTELVEANSKLAGISGIGAIAGGAVSVVTMWVMTRLGSTHGPDMALFFAGLVYLGSTVQAVRLPALQVADAPADEAETTELHSPSIIHAAVAVSVVRVVVGFITFMLAFHFKNLEETDSWASKVGLVGSLLGAEVGFLLGAVVAPRLRRVVTEENIIMLALGLIGVAGLLTALMGDLAGAILLAFTVGLASNSAKQAFDAIVQRDAPDANRGRAFAKFETKFQLWWVIGALFPVIVGAVWAFPPRLGYLFIGLACAGGLAWFSITLRQALAAARRRPSPLAGEPVLVEPRPVSRSFLRGRRGLAGSVGDPGPVEVTAGVPGAGFAAIDSDATEVQSAYDAHVGVVPGAPARPYPGGEVLGPDDTTLVTADAGWGQPGYGDPIGDVAQPGFAPPTGNAVPMAYAAPGYAAPPGHPAPVEYGAEPGGMGLFGDPDLHQPVDPVSPYPPVTPPGVGLFATGEPPAPVLFDSAAWHDEDATPVPMRVGPSAATSEITGPPPAPAVAPPRDPGPPSLVPPTDDHGEWSYPEPPWRDAPVTGPPGSEEAG